MTYLQTLNGQNISLASQIDIERIKLNTIINNKTLDHNYSKYKIDLHNNIIKELERQKSEIVKRIQKEINKR